MYLIHIFGILEDLNFQILDNYLKPFTINLINKVHIIINNPNLENLE